MAKKSVTTKIQIPKWYVKRIKGFERLTENEALFEYEALKLRERQRKYASKAGIKGYRAPQIPRPSYVTSSDVSYLKQITPSEVKLSATTGFDRLVEPTSSIYAGEREAWKAEKFEGYVPNYGDDYYDDSYDYDIPSHSYDSTDLDDYWINPATGEAVLWDDIRTEDAENAAREFLEDLKEQLREEADKTVIGHSTTAQGRTKSRRVREFYSKNVDNALDSIIQKIDSILNDPQKFQRFVASHRDSTNSWEQLVMAAMDYIHSSYVSKSVDQAAKAAELNALLTAGPISLSDALNYVEDAYDVEE